MTLPKIVWPYSLFQKAWNSVYFSGQIGINPDSWILADTIESQTIQACENIKIIAKEAWVEMRDIVKTTVFITDMTHYWAVNTLYAEYFSHKPARSCVAVKELPAGAIVEIEVIAYK